MLHFVFLIFDPENEDAGFTSDNDALGLDENAIFDV